MTYAIGKDRQYNASNLLGEDCTSPVSGITITQATPVRTALNASYNTLTLEYDIDMSAIAGSLIWNETSSELKVCQVLQLIEQGMVIHEDKHQAIITFYLGVGFTIAGQDLAEATVSAVKRGSVCLCSIHFS